MKRARRDASPSRSNSAWTVAVSPCLSGRTTSSGPRFGFTTRVCIPNQTPDATVDLPAAASLRARQAPTSPRRRTVRHGDAAFRDDQLTVATDEIYEKYLQKAITEINALGDELAQAAGGARVPVVGSGHPLADVFLLKYAPKASELQEGVAFYGRAGNALLKSLQRLHVDPMAIYGTNCLKFADGDEEESRPFLLRELHIVQPKLVVAMGEPARRVPQRGRASRSRAS